MTWATVCLRTATTSLFCLLRAALDPSLIGPAAGVGALQQRRVCIVARESAEARAPGHRHGHALHSRCAAKLERLGVVVRSSNYASTPT